MPSRIAYGMLIFTILTQARVVADSGANHRTKQAAPIKLGTSGGNIKDKFIIFCCSGTLGSVVKRGTTEYILSNNHILARKDLAAVGEDIIQPGLVDTQCSTSTTKSTVVADLSQFAKLRSPNSSNVDAAIAQTRSGKVSAEILDIGYINPTPLPASLGLNVMKSGRTTGLTTGGVGAIEATVNVSYSNSCGSSKTFMVTFTNQIIIDTAGFSAGGDSGSLIVSNEAGACKQPVGLLYAGSSTLTAANPIGEVLSKLGGNLEFVTGQFDPNSCPLTAGTSPSSTQGIGPSQASVDYARIVKNRHSPNLLRQSGVLGIGVGADDDNPSESGIVIYVQTGRALEEAIPEFLDGLRVKVVTTEPFVAYGTKKWGDNGCGQ